LRWVNNHHISNEDLVLLGHVKIGLWWNSWPKGVPLFFPCSVPTLSNEGIHDVLNGVICGYPLTSKWATN
jgi:hypothetical protein